MPAWYPVTRLIVALVLMTLGGSAMYASVLVLGPAALEFGVGRGAASLPYALYMVGFGVGGVVMGRVSDRIGILLPALAGSLFLPAGLLAAADAQSIVTFCLAMSGLCGLLGAAFTFAPLVSDISHWFHGRRGLAVGVVISGNYLAGAVWPTILQHYFDLQGWRETFQALAMLNLACMLPLALCLYPRPLLDEVEHDTAGAPRYAARPLGLSRTQLQCLVCAAGVGCCIAMAMPQVHIVPYALDKGFAAQRGAEMLALMLGFGIVSRVISGWLSDRIGGLRTLLLGSTLQALVLVWFMFADSLVMLYAAAVAFGLAQGGIVPSYAIIVRTFFPAGQAGWRIGVALLSTLCGMAVGSYMAGALYDLTGSYTASYVNAIAFNLLNMAIAAGLLRQALRLMTPPPVMSVPQPA
jgi:MFS family permease